MILSSGPIPEKPKETKDPPMNPKHSSVLLITFATAFSALAAGAEPAADSRHPFTVGADVGTLGFGGSGSWRFADHFGFRLGVHAFSYSYDADIESVKYSTKLDLSSQSLGLDWHPWKKSSFRLTAGVLFNQMELTGNATAAAGTTFELDGVTYLSTDVGTLNAKIEPDPVNFYVGIGGNLYLGSKHHWSIGGELGLVHVGKYDISLARSGGVANAAIDASIAAERQKIQNSADDFPFYPVLQIGLNYSF